MFSTLAIVSWDKNPIENMLTSLPPGSLQKTTLPDIISLISEETHQHNLLNRFPYEFYELNARKKGGIREIVLSIGIVDAGTKEKEPQYRLLIISKHATNFCSYM